MSNHQAQIIVGENRIVISSVGIQGAKGDPGNATQINQKMEVLSPSQTTWALTSIPVQPHLSKFYIQGQKQIYGIDYGINGGIITWNGYILKSHWTIELYYFY